MRINVSVSKITSILRKEFILSLKANKASKKAKKKSAIIRISMLNLEDAHARPPRCAYLGEMIQMDASSHIGFGNKKTHLHIAVDDASGQIVGAFFNEHKTLNGYYHVSLSDFK